MKKIFFIIVFSLIFSIITKSEEFSPVKYIPQSFDVLKYTVNLDLQNLPNNDFNGTCNTKIKLLDKKNRLEYKFSLRSLKIDSIIFINKEFQFTLDTIGDESKDNFHFLIKPKFTYDPKDIPDTINVFIKYHGKMTNEGGKMDWGGVSFYGNSIFSMGVGFYNNYISCAQHWFPCFDHPSDKALFEFEFTTQKGYSVASNGILKINQMSDKSIFHYVHNFPTSTYLVNFAFDSYSLDYIPNNLTKTPIEIFSQSLKKEDALTLFNIIPSALKIYEKLYGEYPFEKVGYCLTAIGSMEHQTMISFDKNLINKPISNSAKYVAVHELAHQWFGDAVSPLDFRDAWLNESFATYSEGIWIENSQNWDAYIQKMRSDLSQYMSLSQSEGIVPIYDFPRDIVGNYPGTIYYKGSVVLGLLRYEIGDSLFFGFLKYYIDKYKYKNISTAVFLEEINNFTKTDLTHFFNEWIYKKGYPKIAVEWNYLLRDKNSDYSKIRLHLIQTQDNSFTNYINLPIELKFNIDNKYNKLIRLTQKDEYFEIDSLPYSAFVGFNQGNKLITPLKIDKISFLNVEDFDFSSKISPNPSNDFIEINLDLTNIDCLDLSKIYIFNNLGEEVNSEKILSIVNNKLILDISNLINGNYYIKIGNKIEKFIKL